MVKFHGVEINLGERIVTLPKLTCGILHRHWPRFVTLRAKAREQKAGEDSLEYETDTVLELSKTQNSIIFEALKRNYPEMTLSEVEDSISPGESTAIFAKLMVLSSMVSEPHQPGEAQRP